MVLNNFIKVACLSTCLGLASGSILANSNYNIDTNGGLKVYDTSNNDHWFHLSGKVQFDQSVYHSFNNNKNQRISQNNDLGGVEVDLKGGIGQNTSYQVRLNRKADGSLNINKAQLNYSGFNEWSRVSVGHIGMPYGLDTGSSFLERSLATSMFAPSSGFGMGLDAWTDKVGLRVALTQPKSTKDDSGERLNASFRLSCAPYNTDNLIFHMGLSGQHVTSDHGLGNAFNNNLSANSEFNARARDNVEAETGDQKVSSYNVVSADAAVLRGPLFVQGEYHKAAHTLVGEGEAVNAMGWNVQASYAITGESRDYNYQKGSFSNIRTERDSGSWEVALRHSFVRCHQGKDMKSEASTLGGSVSWVANNNITVLANYIHTPLISGGNDNVNTEGSLSLRVQAAW